MKNLSEPFGLRLLLKLSNDFSSQNTNVDTEPDLFNK